MSPSPIRRLHRSGDPYPVLLGAGLLETAGLLTARLWPKRRIGVVTQRRVFRLHGARLVHGLEGAGIDSRVLYLPEGEENKSLRTVERMFDALLRHRFSREDALVAFGGGLVGDVTGFVAATYLRGIDYAQIPTTLLAQVDSSIGAKVGVNHPRGKNLIGAIHRPKAVWIDPSVLVTLAARDFRSGLYELLKYGFIGAPALLRRMEKVIPAVGTKALDESISRAVRRKLQVVREDEAERGLRRILNFGHTIGHGLEAASEYRGIRHGEAVGWGMMGAIKIAARRGRLSRSLAGRLSAAVSRIGPLPPLAALSEKQVLRAIDQDKKIGKRGLRFVIPVGLGRVDVVEGLPRHEIAWALKELGVS